jgi:hypothetical protein
MISLVIILALVTVPLVLIARLSFTVLARLLGVVSQSEVTTRAEFARIREQLLATAGDDGVSAEGAGREPDSGGPTHRGGAIEPQGGAVLEQPRSAAPERRAARSGAQRPVINLSAAEQLAAAEWRRCPTCMASVSSTASMCLQCGSGLSAQS